MLLDVEMAQTTMELLNLRETGQNSPKNLKWKEANPIVLYYSMTNRSGDEEKESQTNYFKLD